MTRESRIPAEEFLHSFAAGAAHCSPTASELSRGIHLPLLEVAIRPFAKLLWTIVTTFNQVPVRKINSLNPWQTGHLWWPVWTTKNNEWKYFLTTARHGHTVQPPSEWDRQTDRSQNSFFRQSYGWFKSIISSIFSAWTELGHVF